MWYNNTLLLRVLILKLMILNGFKGNNASFIQHIPLRSLNLQLNPLDDSIWQNDGFEKVNTTQVSRRLGSMEHYTTSTVSLMASKPARLITYLKDFEGNFLYINFSSLIGKSVTPPVPQVTTTTTLMTTTLATTTTTRTTSQIPEVHSPHPEEAVIKVESIPAIHLSPATSIINSSSNHHSIIHISLDPTDPNLKTEIHKVIRKKRELDSSDILQIHHIINLANNANAKKDKPITSISTTNLISNVSLVKDTDTIVNNNEILNKQNVKIPNQSTKVHIENRESIELAYQHWKTSTISKNIRPPGFYVLIDDEVVFDNWAGVWNNLPNVIGKWNSNSHVQISNRTNILYTWENMIQNRIVKVSFEWEPMDSSTFLFLDDILISTYQTNNITTQKYTNTESSPTPPLKHKSSKEVLDESTSNVGNRNITIYIIVKSDTSNQLTQSVLRTPINENQPEQNLVNGTGLKLKNLNIINKPVIPELSNHLDSIKNRTRNVDMSRTNKQRDLNYAFIILTVLGCTFFVILIFLLWIKMTGGKKCGRIHC